jgi:hypothetical protein
MIGEGFLLVSQLIRTVFNLFTAEKTHLGETRMKLVSISIVLGVLASVLIGMTVQAASTDAVPKMTQEQAKSMLGSEVIFVDVRAPKDWNASDSKIKGAVREDPSNISSWADIYSKEKTLLFYCA